MVLPPKYIFNLVTFKDFSSKPPFLIHDWLFEGLFHTRLAVRVWQSGRCYCKFIFIVHPLVTVSMTHEEDTDNVAYKLSAAPCSIAAANNFTETLRDWT